MSSSQTSYDYVIIGANLEGLLLARFLHNKGIKTLLIEESDKIGGLFLNPLFTSFAASDLTPGTTEPINALSSRLGFEFSFHKRSAPPLTYEKGSLVPFVGFGDCAPKEAEFLQDFIFAQRFDLLDSLQHLVQQTVASGIQIRFNSTITSFTTTELEINDRDIISSKNFIWTKNPSDLLSYDNLNLSSKTVSRLSKSIFWTTLHLELTHKQSLTESNQIHLLYGTQKMPSVAVGQFQKTTPQSSHWFSLIPADSNDISEDGVNTLKEMKRQINRAYPQIFDQIEFEKISLTQKTHGYIDLKTKHFGQPEGLENIFICSSHLVEHSHPVMAALIAARYTLEVLEKRPELVAQGENISLQS